MTARMTNGDWLIAQIGLPAQIGLRRSLKEQSRPMLLDPKELPDNALDASRRDS